MTRTRVPWLGWRLRHVLTKRKLYEGHSSLAALRRGEARRKAREAGPQSPPQPTTTSHRSSDAIHL